MNNQEQESKKPENKNAALFWLGLALAIVFYTLYNLSSGIPPLLVPAALSVAGIALLNARQRLTKYQLPPAQYNKLSTGLAALTLLFFGLNSFL